jgi:hypothetical protein
MIKDKEKECTFRPNLNPYSEEIGRPTCTEELVNNERNKRIKQLLAERQEEEWRRVHQFHPKLIANNYKAMQSKYKLIEMKDPESISQNVQKYQEVKKRKLALAKEKQEQKELDQCTFHPEIYSSKRRIATYSGPVVVRGLGKHLERKERAKKLLQEKLEREKAVFRPKITRPDPSLPFTIPEPFNLS